MSVLAPFNGFIGKPSFKLEKQSSSSPTKQKYEGKNQYQRNGHNHTHIMFLEPH